MWKLPEHVSSLCYSLHSRQVFVQASSALESLIRNVLNFYSPLHFVKKCI